MLGRAGRIGVGRLRNGTGSGAAAKSRPGVTSAKVLGQGLANTADLPLYACAFMAGRATSFGSIAPFGLAAYAAARYAVPRKLSGVAIEGALGMLSQGPRPETALRAPGGLGHVGTCPGGPADRRSSGRVRAGAGRSRRLGPPD